jgi:hypothetical protein
MEILESVLLIGLGFGPTLAALEIAWKMGLKKAVKVGSKSTISSGYPSSFGSKVVEEKKEAVISVR